MPYQIPVLKEFVGKYNAEVHVVYWDIKGNAPYVPPTIENTVFYARTQFTTQQLSDLVANIEPSIIFISGWQDKGYLKVVKPYKKNGVPVVSGFDDIWHGSFRQRIGAFIFPFFRYNYFSHAWVSGPRQYEFAKRLGFKDHNIVYNLYSGNTDLFNQSLKYLDSKAKNYPKHFLFVGRFAPAKAIDVLADAYKIYRAKYKGDWQLTCIGKGELRHLLDNGEQIIVHDFMEQDAILRKIEHIGAFVLPSRTDVSPLVVHEFASAGLPLILSESIGNRLMFLIENFNGFTFKKNSAEDLALKMAKMSAKSTNELMEMSNNSYLLSKQHHAKFVAASFISILK